MKMKLSELRQVIRQVLSEMPFRGVLPSANISSKENQPDSGPASFRAMDRFHRTPQFQKKAIAAFRGLPVEAYFLPIKIDKNLPFLEQDARLTIKSPAEGLKLLQQVGADVDFEDLQEKLAGGATIFLSFVGKLERSFLPTPWLTIHAMFDNDVRGDKTLDALRSDVEVWIEDEEPYTYEEEFPEIMTTGSARNDELRTAGINDIVSELLTQEIATRRGVTFKYPPDIDPEKKEKFMNLEKFIKSLDPKSKFSEAVGGKLVFIQNATIY